MKLKLIGSTKDYDNLPQLGKGDKPYTAYGRATISGFPFNFGPCYSVATKGKYGGVIGGVGTLLKGVFVPAAASAVIELYSGKQTSAKC